MGLSGRKVKQRIGADPRNLSWADDAARFGQNYLSKFGWDTSKGLGAGGDGMKSHIKVSHKLDMLGIGAAQTKDPNGIAWKQNRDFENLLKRLNENLADDLTPADSEVEEENEEEGGDKKKKRKHKERAEGEDAERKQKKSKKAKGDEELEKSVSVAVDTLQIEEVVEVKKAVALPRHRAHRARAIAAKNISSKSAAHISEILGIAPNPVASSSSETASKGKLTSVTETNALGMDKITTSTKSLADYFKDKLNARMGFGSSTSTPSSSSRTDEVDPFDVPRGGIGASRMHLEIQSETRIEEETQRVGLSKFSSLKSSSFLAATSSFSSYSPAALGQEDVVMEEQTARICEVDSDSGSGAKEKSGKRKEKKHRHNGSKEDEEKERVEEKPKKEKKSKKDNNGKGNKKEESEVPATDGDEKTRRKKEKKDKKKAKPEATVEEETVESEKVEEEYSEKASSKKEKRKEKSAKTDEPPTKSESRKEREKRRKSTTADS